MSRKRERDKGNREGGLPFGEELRGVILRRGKELARDDEIRTKNGFCRGKAGDVMGRGTKGKKEPRKVCWPIRGGAASTKSEFQGTVATFHHSIRLRVKGGCGDVGKV